MLELVVLVCLANSPTYCKDAALNYSAESTTPMQCLMQAQIEIAKWVAEHPNWRVERYSCRPAGQIAKT